MVSSFSGRLDFHRLFAFAIQDGGNLAFAAKLARNTLARTVASLGFELCSRFHEIVTPCSR